MAASWEHRAARANVLKTAKVCAAPLRSLGVIQKKPIACGLQGCVYKTRGGDIVKVAVVGNDNDAGPALWLITSQYQKGEKHMHPALPKLGRVVRLTGCLQKRRSMQGRGVYHAFVTVREDIPSLPRHFPHSRDLDDLLLALESWVYTKPVTAFLRAHRSEIAALGPSDKSGKFITARVIFDEIASLHAWLWARGLILTDLHLDNIGAVTRKQRSDLKKPFQIVARDIGFLRFRRKAKREVTSMWADDYIAERVLQLGGLGDDCDCP